MPCSHRALPALALILASALPAGLVHAASASASIQQVSLQLIDLDPNDAIAPSITFSSEYDAATSTYRLAEGGRVLSQSRTRGLGSTEVNGPAGSASTSSSADTWSSIASLAGDPAGTPTAHANTAHIAWFTLSPATKAVFSLTASGGALHTGDASRAGATVHVFAILASLEPVQPPGTYFSLYRDVTGPDATFSFSGELNSPAGDPVFGTIEINTSAFATLYDPASPVPEPSSYAMLLAGAAIVGAARRRRKRH